MNDYRRFLRRPPVFVSSKALIENASHVCYLPALPTAWKWTLYRVLPKPKITLRSRSRMFWTMRAAKKFHFLKKNYFNAKLMRYFGLELWLRCDDCQ